MAGATFFSTVLQGSTLHFIVITSRREGLGLTCKTYSNIWMNVNEREQTWTIVHGVFPDFLVKIPDLYDQWHRRQRLRRGHGHHLGLQEPSYIDILYIELISMESLTSWWWSLACMTNWPTTPAVGTTTCPWLPSGAPGTFLSDMVIDFRTYQREGLELACKKCTLRLIETLKILSWVQLKCSVNKCSCRGRSRLDLFKGSWIYPPFGRSPSSRLWLDLLSLQ